VGGQTSDDGREHPRFVVDAMVEIMAASGALLRGRTRNISRGGLCVELHQALAAGEEVELRIALLFQDRRQTEALALPARIVWCTPLGDGCQVGSQFLRLSADQAAYLDLFLGYIDASPEPTRERSAPFDGIEDDPFGS
jgi:Tfp pilus assembly protein PilZ